MLSTIEGLKKTGFDVVLAIPSNWPFDEDFMARIESLGLRIYKIHIVHFRDDIGWSNKFFPLIPYLRRWKNLLKERLLSYSQLCSIIEIEHPDIVHSNVGIIHDGFWAAKRYKVPHVFHIREYQDKDFNWNILPNKGIFRWMLRHSEAVITISDDIRYHFNLRNSVNAVTIYNGIFSRNDYCLESPKQKFFLCASRISPEKGCEDVLEAFAIFLKKNKTFRLLFAGGGNEEYIMYLKNYARSLRCDEYVDFLGHVQDVKNLMKLATALIVASYNEAFGRMTAEALFQGCFVIGRDSGGTKEIMDKVGGFRFVDIPSLVHKMNYITSLSDEQYRETLSPIQQRTVCLFSIEENISKISRLYRKIV